MAKIDFTKSRNEGHYTFCGIFNIELDKEDLKRISGGKVIISKLQDEIVNIDFMFFIKKGRMSHDESIR